MQMVLIHMEMKRGQQQQRIEYEYELTSVLSGQPGSTTNNLKTKIKPQKKGTWTNFKVQV